MYYINTIIYGMMTDIFRIRLQNDLDWLISGHILTQNPTNRNERTCIAMRYFGLTALYAFWALAICSRATWQYVTRTGDHLPTHLSAIAGLLYLLIAYWAWRGWAKALLWGLIIELGGVIVIGTYEIFYQFSYATAWSQYGAGYLYMPLILPIIGLVIVQRQQMQ